MTRILIGVMGPGEGATAAERNTAFQLGQAIATRGWTLLTGGRASGVMDAASHGAQAAGGLVIGILPGEEIATLSAAVDIPILTGMGQARNTINVLSSRVVIACGWGAGTLAEIALALKLRKPLVLMHVPPTLVDCLRPLAIAPLWSADTIETAMHSVERGLDSE